MQQNTLKIFTTVKFFIGLTIAKGYDTEIVQYDCSGYFRNIDREMLVEKINQVFYPNCDTSVGLLVHAFRPDKCKVIFQLYPNKEAILEEPNCRAAFENVLANLTKLAWGTLWGCEAGVYELPLTPYYAIPLQLPQVHTAAMGTGINVVCKCPSLQMDYNVTVVCHMTPYGGYSWMVQKNTMCLAKELHPPTMQLIGRLRRSILMILWSIRKIHRNFAVLRKCGTTYNVTLRGFFGPLAVACTERLKATENITGDNLALFSGLIFIDPENTPVKSSSVDIRFYLPIFRVTLPYICGQYLHGRNEGALWGQTNSCPFQERTDEYVRCVCNTDGYFAVLHVKKDWKTLGSLFQKTARTTRIEDFHFGCILGLLVGSLYLILLRCHGRLFNVYVEHTKQDSQMTMCFLESAIQQLLFQTTKLVFQLISLPLDRQYACVIIGLFSNGGAVAYEAIKLVTACLLLNNPRSDVARECYLKILITTYDQLQLSPTASRAFCHTHSCLPGLHIVVLTAPVMTLNLLIAVVLIMHWFAHPLVHFHEWLGLFLDTVLSLAIWSPTVDAEPPTNYLTVPFIRLLYCNIAHAAFTLFYQCMLKWTQILFVYRWLIGTTVCRRFGVLKNE
ncbi:uncharacterized protein DEA37_0011802 [Paragonimus westermani]|uniref:Uncharacterized protein n=1 Tax=Paragonimus westermani TaxID=34504 RepID=A0A5J4NLM9_9TREM|nr:uncharacterized protein DEA37_0011802 [Paragonimus westermani]